MGDDGDQFGKLRLGQKWIAQAVDFGRIFSTMKQGDHERMLLWAIQEFSWDHSDRGRRAVSRWPDARPFVMPMGDLAKLIDPDDEGYLRKKLYDARLSLKKDRVIVEKAGGLLVNTSVQEWAPGRLRPSYLSYARAAITRAKPPEKAVEAGANQGLLEFRDAPDKPAAMSPRKDTDILQEGYQSSCEIVDISPRGDIHVPQEGYGYPPGRISPIEERARGLKVLESSKELNSSLPPAACEGCPSPTIRTLGGLAVPGSDSPEAIALAERVRASYGGLPAAVARAWCDDIPVEWVEVGFRRRIRGKPGMTEKRISDLLGAIFEQWRAAGECDFVERPVDTGPAEPGAPRPRVGPAREHGFPSDIARREERDSIIKPEDMHLFLSGD